MNNQVKDSSYQAMFITVILGKINLKKIYPKQKKKLKIIFLKKPTHQRCIW